MKYVKLGWVLKAINHLREESFKAFLFFSEFSLFHFLSKTQSLCCVQKAKINADFFSNKLKKLKTQNNLNSK